MKALSVKQPWANLIAAGYKSVETRTWITDYRGELLIVSSKNPKIHPAGSAVAIVDLVDSRQMTHNDEHLACCELYPDAKAWVLERIRPIDPIPIKGRLGIYDIDCSPTILDYVPRQILVSTRQCLSRMSSRAPLASTKRK